MESEYHSPTLSLFTQSNNASLPVGRQERNGIPPQYLGGVAGFRLGLRCDGKGVRGKPNRKMFSMTLKKPKSQILVPSTGFEPVLPA